MKDAKLNRIDLYADELRESVKLGYPLTDATSIAILQDLAEQFDAEDVPEADVVRVLYTSIFPELN